MSYLSKIMLGYNALALVIVGRPVPGTKKREYPSTEQAFAYLERGVDFEGEIGINPKKETPVLMLDVNLGTKQEGTQISFL